MRTNKTINNMAQCRGLVNGKPCTREPMEGSFYCNNCVHGQRKVTPIKGVNKYTKERDNSKKNKKITS